MKYSLFRCENSSGRQIFAMGGDASAVQELLLFTDFFRCSAGHKISSKCKILEYSSENHLGRFVAQVNNGEIAAPKDGWPEAMTLETSEHRFWSSYANPKHDVSKPIKARSKDTGSVEFYMVPNQSDTIAILERLRIADAKVEELEKKVHNADWFRDKLKEFIAG